CHHHKYDPISQEEYFRLFAILNNTEDADRPDEAPVLKFYTPAEKEKRDHWQQELDELNKKLDASSKELAAGQVAWEKNFPLNLLWQDGLEVSGAALTENAQTTQYLDISENLLRALALAPRQRDDFQDTALADFYRRHVAPELRAEQQRFATVKFQMTDMEIH